MTKKHSQSGGRHLPIFISNDKMTFYSYVTDNFVVLPHEYTILFDTGNGTKTLIGDKVVEYLNLPFDQSCTKVHGVGGQSTCSFETVIQYNLLYPYNHPVDKIDDQEPYMGEFSAIISNDTTLGHNIIIGQDGGMDVLFSLGYHVDAIYHDDHEKNILQFIKSSHVEDLKLGKVSSEPVDIIMIYDHNLKQIDVDNVDVLKRLLISQNIAVWSWMLLFYDNRNNIYDIMKTNSMARKYYAKMTDCFDMLLINILDHTVLSKIVDKQQPFITTTLRQLMINRAKDIKESSLSIFIKNYNSLIADQSIESLTNQFKDSSIMTTFTTIEFYLSKRKFFEKIMSVDQLTDITQSIEDLVFLLTDETDKTLKTLLKQHDLLGRYQSIIKQLTG